MKKGIQLLLALVIIGLIYVIAVQIHTPLSFDKQMKVRNAAVIAKLKDIRTAERAFKGKYQHFTDNFDTLINFVLTDSIEFEFKLVDEDDSVGMAKLKKSGKKNIEKRYVNAIDTIFSPRKLTAEDIKNLRYIPYTDNMEFLLEANNIVTESKVEIPVVECRAPYKAYLDTVAFRQQIINLIDDQAKAVTTRPATGSNPFRSYDMNVRSIAWADFFVSSKYTVYEDHKRQLRRAYHSAAQEPEGAPHYRFRQGESFQRPRQQVGFRRRRGARSLRGYGLYKLRVRFAGRRVRHIGGDKRRAL